MESYIKIDSRIVFMNREISYRDPKRFLYQAANMFISAVKLDILTCGCGTDWPPEPASSSHSKNCSFGISALVSFFSLRAYPYISRFIRSC